MPIRLAVTTVPLTALLWLGIGAYLVQKHRADLTVAAAESRNLTYAFEENIRRTIEATDTTIRALRAARAHDPAHFDIIAWEHDSGLTRELTLQLSLVDRTGTVVATNLGPVTRHISIADRAHFRILRDRPEDLLFISRPVIGRVSGKWSVQFVRRLSDSAGAFDGVIVASFDPTFLSRFYGSLDIGRGALILAGQDGFVRAVAPATMALPDANLANTSLMDAMSAAAHGALRTADAIDGIDRIFSWRRVEPYDLTVVVGLSTADALADYRANFRGCMVIGCVLTLIIFLVSLALTRNRLDILRSRAILRAAVDNISQGLLVIDAQRRVPVLNARAAELLGLPPELTKAGFAFDTLLAWQVNDGEFEAPDAAGVRALVRAGGIEFGSSVYQRTRRDGTVLEIRTKALDTGLAVRTFTDITEQQRTAHVLAEARDAAEAAARARAEFLAVMSHEIRTPLNGVIGVAGLLEDMELGDDQRAYVRLIRESGDHLLELINDILDFSRLEAAKVQLEAIAFDPGRLAQGVVSMFLAPASTKGLHLSVTMDGTMPPAVIGDPGRLRQVLLNLVGNAIKFTEQGWVSLGLAVEPAKDGRQRLLFSVGDSGIGIEPEAIGRMFDEFTQVDGSISRRFGGSGLGLAICRRLVELMGGTISVQSEPGSGSTFRFDVTLPPVIAPPPPDIDPAATAPVVPLAPLGPGLRILLAEDNPTNRIVALRLLERLGHHADAVGSGVEVIAAVGLTAYDLIVMDVMMPEMDGLTATRRIRAAERPDDHLVIVGLTAGSQPDNLAACLAAGMDAVTTKPVTIARLRAAIAEGLGAAVRYRDAGDQDVMTPRLRELVEELGDAAVAEIVDTFVVDTQALLLTLRDAAARGDGKAIRGLAHSMAGAARNVGAAALAEHATSLEQGAGSLTPRQIETEVASMQRELDATLVALTIGHRLDA